MRNLIGVDPGASTRRLVLLAVVALGALAIVPATSSAVKFGSKLTPQVQPSNSGQPKPCEPNPGQCSRVMNEAYGRPNKGHKAKRNGKIKRIRIIAGAPGKFQFQLYRRKAGNKFKAVYTSKKRFNYQGQPDGDEPYKIESFGVNIPVKKNMYIGTKARQASYFRCSSGGDNLLFFQPPLAVGGSWLKPDTDDGCWMLIEAVIK